ncbi:MAG TPA: PQQ-dependent dehydrogenase, methanol/ethanol family [Steroidobacteraceae bacterium]|nr:PQQ-dependent dehydrogenase, methanol/ethanol family [Steroidobacteraceae bacterium]
MRFATSLKMGSAVALTCLIAPLSASAAGAPSVKPGEWSLHGGDYSEQRYSTLKQITADNIKDLGLAWSADLTERGQYQSTPVVVDGRLYVTTPWSKVYAFDAKTGEKLWKYDPKVPRELASTSLCCNNSNRGVTYSDGKIFLGTLDGRLIAVDAKKGTQVWETHTTDPNDAMSITGAPRVGNGIVFIGQAGSEFHQRGYMSAYDAKTGKQLWKFFLTPGNPAKGPDHAASDPMMAMAAKTWKGEWWKTGGGATPWDGIVYDPQTDLVIFGTGNGAPWPAEVRSPGGGDNLFTSSIVALEAKTGKYKWHYQTVPMDNFDFDNTSPLTIADLTIDGQKKHVVMQIPKNGVFYVIEAGTGKVQSAQLVVPFANWLTGFDKANNWAPVLNPDANFGKTGKGWFVVPFQTHVWYPQSYNPNTGLFYVGVRYATYGMVSEAGAKMGNQLLSINVAKRPEMAAPKLEGTGGWLVAWDPVKQKEVWRSTGAGLGQAGSGTMTTAGNLVFQGTQPRNLTAFRADTGEKVWSGEAGVNISAGSITYDVGGTQYVAAVGAGQGSNPARLVVYKLGGTATLPPVAPPAPPVAFNPPASFGSDAQLARGKELYTQNCTICHEGGRGMGGFPDLRTTPMMQNAEVFKAIVYDGALTDNGMLSFKKALTPEDVEAIRAHIVTLAIDLKANPQRGFGGGPGGGGRGAGGGPAGAAPAAPAAEQPAQGLHQ